MARFRVFTGLECCAREGWGKIEASQDQGSGFSRAGPGGQGSGFSLASGLQVSTADSRRRRFGLRHQPSYQSTGAWTNDVLGSAVDGFQDDEAKDLDVAEPAESSPGRKQLRREV